MTFRLLLMLLVSFLTSLLSAPAKSQQSDGQRPNILFIYDDDHSPKTISCYERAYPMARTPNIDQLAATGVRFRAGYMGSWCMPSRAALLTGLHPHAIETMRMEGPYPGSTYDPQVCRFWPAIFRQQGYHTAQIGKWHTGTDSGWGRDWDFQIVWNRPANPDNAGSYYGPQIMDLHGERRTVEGYSTDNYTRWACDYIRGEGRDADKPWYLWLCYGAIHGPTIPADRHKGLLKDQPAELPADIFGPRPGKPMYLENTQAWRPGAEGGAVFGNGKRTHTEWLQQVNECMRSVDEGIGQVMQTLRETGQLENTLVVYTSDQGFANGEHGMKQKVAPYDATYSSPMIVSWPVRFPQGKFCRHAVNAPDVVVTFFALAGFELPWPMHGRDFTSLLLDPENASWDRPTLFVHTGRDYGSDVTRAIAGEREAVHSGVPYYAALSHQGMKYIRYLAGNEAEELYDLDRDPEELTNLAGESGSQAVLSRLREQLLDELQLTDAKFLEHLPAVAADR